MGNYSSVPCEEVFNTTEGTRDLMTWNQTVNLRCTWANRNNLVNDLLGTPRSHPSNNLLVAQSCGIKPEPTKYTSDGQEIVYENAIVTVNYGIPGGDKGSETPQDPVKLVSESLEPYTQVITLPWQEFEWNSDGEALKAGEEPGKVIHGIKLVRTIFKVQVINSSILGLPGSVHNASFYSTILNLTFAAETLLFMPPILNRTITTAGIGAWNLKLSWDYKPEGWNSVWRVAIGGYDSLRIKGGGPYNSYEPKNHSAFLF